MRKPCCDKQETNKGAWSKQEDQKLIDYIKTHGEGCWRSLPKAAGLHRCGKSCRLRWINYLRPDLKRGNFGLDEEDLIIKLHALLGNRWSLIAGRLPGRTDNEVKNYWNSHIKRKLIKMGVDPNNHRVTLNLPKPAASPRHCVSASATSSESMDNDHHAFNNPVKSLVDDDGGVVGGTGRCLSDTTSWHEDDQTSGSLLIDLNLDLTIAVPCPPSSPMFMETKSKPLINEWTMASREVDQSDTLLLFT